MIEHTLSLILIAQCVLITEGQATCSVPQPAPWISIDQLNSACIGCLGPSSVYLHGCRSESAFTESRPLSGHSLSDLCIVDIPNMV